ncbi:exodeoxyribonuclease VII small subunit [Belliella sp. DSM 111904]|uniref:Exodeoxyribonuclease VII small subunit n=1 Tax=Belliella filtrata TaxID=2923435 RepID=A0ABS9UZ15_9BACT|nr:exodeoxyribonuclease VII small subunit [Belliella filtrata]MCH7409415.1 exodeoxyribonuclease VII small subunit [Belliella filtrata]
MENNELSYDQAVKRIEEIVSILESGDKGIDQLSALVKEASTLVKDCREKLRNTENEINKAFEE